MEEALMREEERRLRQFRILQGDVMERLRELPEESVQCVVTSPPYWGLRDYGIEEQIGLERTPEEYVEKMVTVFREVRRVLRGDGVCFLNLGDTYNNCDKWGGGGANTGKHTRGVDGEPESWKAVRRRWGDLPGLKPKDRCMMPARVAMALQADGWWLRDEIVWQKPNPMPERVTDRTTKAHEMVYLLTKSSKYFWDQEAVREPQARNLDGKLAAGTGTRTSLKSESIQSSEAMASRWRSGSSRDLGGRNIRSVWTIPTAPFPEAHFATFPPKLVEPMVKAGTSEYGCCRECGAPWVRVVEKDRAPDEVYTETRNPEDEMVGRASRRGGSGNRHQVWREENPAKTTGWCPSCECGGDPVPCVVLDPFAGAGTTGLVALRLSRQFIGIELNPEYCEMARARILNDAPLLNTELEAFIS